MLVNFISQKVKLCYVKNLLFATFLLRMSLNVVKTA